MPDYLSAYDRKKWSKAIDAMKECVKAEASPGAPCALVANRNDALLSKMGERFNDEVLDRVERILAIPVEQLRVMGRKERLDRGLMDPVRVFVKNEPHKIEKIQQGRVRLIMSVSLTDKMIEMLLSRHICKLEIANWEDIPSKPGIGFTPQDCKTVYDDIIGCGLPMRYADVSGWDLNVKDWMIVDEADNIIKLCDNPSQDWTHLMRSKALLESESIYQFSDGEMVMPTYKGIVNSGKLRTSRGNSSIRVRVADLVGSRKTIAAGDDTVENEVSDAVAKYAKFGIVLKEYEPVRDSFEFCSHVYTPTSTYAVNAEKMVMNLLHQEPKNSLEFRLTMLGFADEMSSHPEYEHILRQIESVGYYEVEGPHYDTEKYLATQDE
nr:RNA-dependent RNA polymerase [Flumine sobemo-like virus 2]